MNENTPHKPLEPGVFQGTPANQNEVKVPPPRLIRTMKSDMAEAVKAQNETLVSIALAEEKKQAALRAEGLVQKPAIATTPAPKPIGRIVVVLVIILIITGIVLAFIFLGPRLSSIPLPSISMPSFGTPEPASDTTEPTAPITVALATSIIPAQSELRIAIDRETPENIFKTITNERTLGLTEGAIKNIYLEESTVDAIGNAMQKAISANRLFILVGVPAPEILTRTLETPFMAGFIGTNGSTVTPFLVLKTTSYETGFAGMLAWETSIARFFDTFFNRSRGGAFGEGRFRDVVILGHDARLLATPQGTIAYAFANTDTIVITTSQGAIEKLLPMIK